MARCKIHIIPNMSTRLQNIKNIRDVARNDFGDVAIDLKNAILAADGKDFELDSEFYVQELRRLFGDYQMTVNGKVLQSWNWEQDHNKKLRYDKEFQYDAERSRLLGLAAKWKSSLSEVEQLYIDVLITEELNG